MVIVVGETVSLREAQDCTRFHVEVADAATPIADALGAAGVGVMDGDDALIDVEWVKAAADDAGVDVAWLSDFETMLAYAGSKGWVSDDGRFVRAHVELAG